jgi:hypothetical protein
MSHHRCRRRVSIRWREFSSVLTEDEAVGVTASLAIARVRETIVDARGRREDASACALFAAVGVDKGVLSVIMIPVVCLSLLNLCRRGTAARATTRGDSRVYYAPIQRTARVCKLSLARVA